MTSEIVSINKLEGAQRQLAMAIRLFFERREPVAIYTLACAAHQVLHDLARDRGFESNLRSAKYIRPGMEREYFAMLTSPQNFLKHANTDPDATFEFKPAVTKYFIFDAVETYRALVGSVFHEGHIFSVWFTLKNPDLLKPSPYRDRAHAFLKIGVDLEDFEMVRQVLNAPEEDWAMNEGTSAETSAQTPQGGQVSCERLEHQLELVVTSRGGEAHVAWMIFSIFWAAQVLLIGVLFQGSDGSPSLGKGLIVSVFGVAMSLVWGLTQGRCLRHVDRFEGLIEKIEEQLCGKYKLQPGHRLTMDGRFWGPRSRIVMRVCCWGIFAAWCLAAAYFLWRLCTYFPTYALMNINWLHLTAGDDVSIFET